MHYKYFLFSLMVLSSFNGQLIAQIIPYDSEPMSEDYQQKIKNFRQRQQASFRNKQTTLLSEEFFPRFTSLNYFLIDEKYRIQGTLTKLAEKQKTNLEMTGGGYYGFVHYGKVNFEIQGQNVELQVFEFPSREPKATAIFLPFRDETTGKETYGGGRFMIVNIPQGDKIVVDFNHAINPICVYDPDHACPVPPLSNRIKTRVEAGAKMYYDPKDIAKPK